MTLTDIPAPVLGGVNRSPLLGLLSDSLDDIEQLRIATENRFRSLTRTGVDSDGQVRGLGFTTDHPEVAKVEAMLTDIEKLEHNAIKSLEREIKNTVFATWIKESKGVGLKQAARLIAVLGDPYWNDLHARPRTVSEMWAYSGYSVIDGAAQRRKKGQKSNWSTDAKTRAFLIAQQCVISGKGGKYETMYRELKAANEGVIHGTDCVRCGPAGKPALAGSELSNGHRDARAKRQVAKEILRDLWLISRESYPHD